jgi:hypothetical protein
MKFHLHQVIVHGDSKRMTLLGFQLINNQIDSERRECTGSIRTVKVPMR